MASGVHVRVEGVRKHYGGVAALADLDLELTPGITGLLGPNGAGKTTLIRILATLLAPSAGQVHVNGWRAASPGDRVEIRRRLGYLPQDLGLYPRFSVFEFVDYLAILKELDDPADRHPARPRGVCHPTHGSGRRSFDRTPTPRSFPAFRARSQRSGPRP
jgi:ABC-2 type transport system ATP-binding protein